MLNFTGMTANFQEWYEKMSVYTPKSTYFRVDADTKKVIMAKTFDKLCENIPYFGETNERIDTTEIDEVAKITSLIKEMNQHIEGKEVFFRTNLFSPKDVKSPCLVSSGEEALELLLSSSRMYRGYHRILKEQDLYLVFREKVDYQEEFRCFIENGHVKGISQYDDSDSVRLAQGSSRLFTLTSKEYLSLIDYVQHVVDATGIRSCVLDVGFIPTGLSVIELNPYGEVTDKSLFANTNIYDMSTSDQTEIRYWKDHQTIVVLEVKKGKVVREYEEWITIKKAETHSRLLALKTSLQDFKLN